MADLVPPKEIAAITTLLGAPYANTFGATETGCPPCSSSLIPIGVAPTRLSKEQSPYCEVRLVDADDRDVPDGSPGELCMRGPTLFSGYWRAPEANAHDFRGGWFHMGDVFVRNGDGTLDFVDRVKSARRARHFPSPDGRGEHPPGGDRARALARCTRRRRCGRAARRHEVG
jgi:fatty-acyl-CoA synthase